MAFDVAASDRLHERVRKLAASTTTHASDVDAALRDVVRAQVDAGGVTARVFRGEDDPRRLPGVPVDAFKLRRVAAHPPELDTHVFRTSGTTQGARGEHFMRTVSTYDALALTWGRTMLWPDDQRPVVIALTPSAAELPDSSLSHMVDLFGRTFGARLTHHVGPTGVEVDSLDEALGRAEREGAPVLLVGTSFAFVHALDGNLPSHALPHSSRVMITGGTKGRSREVSEDDLRVELAAHLGIGARAIVGEYGMTELSSQLYQDPFLPGLVYLAPPWMRVVATDPLTGRDLPDGHEGILKLIDVGNVDSAAIVQTLDLGRVEGGRHVELRGRLAGSEARGCSLLIEEIAAFASENR